MGEVKVFEIFFSDLTEDCQRRLLAEYGCSTPADMNWDLDIAPITEIDIEKEE